MQSIMCRYTDGTYGAWVRGHVVHISLDEGNSSRQELERSKFELDCECCYSIYRNKVVNKLEKDESCKLSRNVIKIQSDYREDVLQ